MMVCIKYGSWNVSFNMKNIIYADFQLLSDYTHTHTQTHI